MTTDEWVERIDACASVQEILDLEKEAQGEKFGPMASAVLMRVFGEKLNILRCREMMNNGTPAREIPPWLKAFEKADRERLASKARGAKASHHPLLVPRKR